MQKRVKRGFTLIELLVVIAIIAILAAILFPVFARAREKARQSNCLSNTKQLVLGVDMYAQDYDEQFPYWTYGTYTWRSGVLPYVRNVQLFQCPSKRLTARFQGGLDVAPAQESGYAINVAHYDTGAPTEPAGAAMGSVYDAASCVIIMESDGPASRGPQANTRGWTPTDEPAVRHNEGANYGFCDGHAKFMKPSQIDSASSDSLLSMEKE